MRMPVLLRMRILSPDNQYAAAVMASLSSQTRRVAIVWPGACLLAAGRQVLHPRSR